MSKSAAPAVVKKKAAKKSGAADEAAAFLRGMRLLQEGLLREFVPVLEGEHGIDFRLYFILKHIDLGMLYPGEISKAMYLPNSVVTRHVDQLAARGLLERVHDAEDSRRIRLVLTKNGTRLVRAAHRSICGIVDTRLDRLTPSARAAFLAALAKLAGSPSQTDRNDS